MRRGGRLQAADPPALIRALTHPQYEFVERSPASVGADLGYPHAGEHRHDQQRPRAPGGGIQ